MLVDQHTLDSYLAACALDPLAVFLVYDRQMAAAFDELADHLRRRLGVRVTGLEVGDDCDLEAMRHVLAHLPQGVHLHYTGGTGLLSAHARTVFEDRWPAAISSCLDEDRRVLRFDDGRVIPLRRLLANHDVTLNDIAELQGYSVVNRSRVKRSSVGGVDDALVVARRVLGQGTHDADLSHLRELDTMAQRSPAWQRFMTGGWLERIVAAAIQLAAPDYEVALGVRLKRGKPTFELDAVAVGRFHPYVVSCSVSRDGAQTKAKLFEVKERTRRLAGAVGRSAVATLADGSSRPSPARLRLDLADLWETSSTPVIFDRSAIERWTVAVAAEDASTLDDLGAWLAS